MNEETFWRNYFYRVSLIKQDPNFTTASGAGGASKSFASSRSSSSSEGPDDPAEAGRDDSEFVSDSYHAGQSAVSAEEVRQDMYKLGIHKKNSSKQQQQSADGMSCTTAYRRFG